MPYKWESKVILGKIETTYGTDANPTGAANAILARNVTFEPAAGTALARNLVKPTLGPVQQPLAGVHPTLQFDVELAPAGGADTPPAYGPMIRACAFAETITPTTGPVEYDPVSSSEESATLYFNVDGVLHKMLGVRGGLELVIGRDEVPLLRFSFTGLYVAPAAGAMPTADFTGFKDPKPVSKTNTPTFTLDSFAAVLSELSINMNTAVAYRDLVNSESVEVTGRVPAGSITIEAPQIGTKDFFAVSKAETLVALQLIHGTGAGNIVQVDAPKVQLLNPRYSEADGIATLQMDLNVAEDSGDDELKITTK